MIDLKNISVLVIDDDALHCEMICQKLHSLGIQDVKSIDRYKDAGRYLDSTTPDLILLDFYLDNGHTGVQFVKEFLFNTPLPVIFISTFYGKEIFEEILEVVPMEFIPKNISEFDLEKVIRLSLAKKNDMESNEKLKDYILVKSTNEIRKILVADIEYIAVDGKYLVLHISDKKFLIRSTLNDFNKKLPADFLKIHQSYIINLKHLYSIQVDNGVVIIGNKEVPFSRNFKKDIFHSYYLS
ncbi:MAG: LytTR family DNA-binding domain-containing protein [Saprospiraceae bacterium]